MQHEVVLIALASLLASAWLTGLVRNLARSHGVLDVPNERSSHTVPTPRGGGVAIVLVVTAALVVLLLRGTAESDLFVALTGGGVAVAIVGLLDDRNRLSAGVRFIVHLAAALWALAWLGGMPALRIADQIVPLGLAGYLLGALGIVWTLNLFNFMDGIDGIAATEAGFVAGAGALLMWIAGASSGLPAASLVLAAAACGFLIWNWPPAKIFMGDVGSGYLGYVIAVLAVAATHEDPVALFVWLILGAAFFVDAMVTLVRRLARRERVYEAHRTHAYQWLSRRWGNHRSVTLAFMAVNVFWLLPLAWYATLRPERSTWVAVAALLPLTAAALLAGAGRAENVPRSGENRSKDE